jgi:nucleoside-diphosphate-sugar epimerase
MTTYLIVGAGAIGSITAQHMADDGHEVRLVSRRGSGPSHPSIELIGADASDRAALTRHAAGVATVFNCANPLYHRWSSDWPPIAASILHAAETVGADLVTLSNLYVYGRPAGAMTPHDPLAADYEKAQARIAMWDGARRAHEQRRVRATEVRASDYVGPGAQSALGDRIVPRVIAGKPCWVIGDPDAPHSWTYTDDVARTLIACAQSEAAWGRAWHVPTNPARSARQAVDDIADAAGVAHVKLSSIPKVALRVVGLFNPVVRELPTTLYQFQAPFIIDDAETRTTFALDPTPWTEALAATVAAARAPSTRVNS